MGDKMTYRVALDDRSKDEQGVMATTWMKAAGQEGIPTAFVVNKQGRLAWIGFPLELNAKLFEDLLADRFDLAKAAADYQKRRDDEAQLSELSGKLNLAMQHEKWDDAATAADAIEKLLPEEQRGRLGVARFQILLGRKDYDGAYKLANSLSEKYPDDALVHDALAWT